jgi:hypothetical protein
VVREGTCTGILKSKQFKSDYIEQPSVAKKAEERQQAPKPGIRLSAAQVRQKSEPPMVAGSQREYHCEAVNN